MSSGGEVVIKITGDDSEYEKKLNGLEKKAKKTASAIDQVTKSSEKAGSAINDTAESLCQKSEKSRKSEGETPPFFAISGLEWVAFV